MARVLLVIVIALALILALFGVQNPQPVNIRFLNWTTGLVPLYVVILISTLAGVLLSSILGLRSRVGTTLRMRRQDRQIAGLEKRLADDPAPETSPVATDEPDAAPSSTLPKL